MRPNRSRPDQPPDPGTRPSPEHGPGLVGSSYDEALAESFFQGLKRELLHGRRWTSKAQMRLKLFRWLSYYIRRRRLPALGYLTPAEFEQQLITSRTPSHVVRHPMFTPGDQPHRAFIP